MARQRKRKRNDQKASPDLTPMIDVTFQLLIFFILCTRFKVEERNHQVQLPLDEGLNDSPSVPVEQITIYCNWDDDTKSNSYQVAIDNRGHRQVPQSTATLQQMVIFPSDSTGTIADKKQRYQLVWENLVAETERYITDSGAKIEKLEISFAKDPVAGAVSGTAPWMFVSLAIDATAKVNMNREERGLEPLKVTFKFADSKGVYTGS